MAYIADPDEDEKKADAEETNALTGAVPAAGGASSSPQRTNKASPPTSTSPEFVSFDQYYGANQSAAENSANQLASSASASADKVETDIDKASSDFRTGLGLAPPPKFEIPTGGGTLSTKAREPAKYEIPTDGGVSSTPRASTTFTAREPTPTVTAAPTRTVSDKKYTGPGSLLDAQFGDLSGGAEHADQQIASLQTPEGIQAAMQGASSGGVSDGLDAALVGRAGGQSFRDLKEKYGSLKSLLERRNGAAVDTANSVIYGQNHPPPAPTPAPTPAPPPGHDYQSDPSDEYKGGGTDPYNPATWTPENKAAYADRTEPSREHPTGTMMWTYPDGRVAEVDVLETPQQTADRADLFKLQQLDTKPS